MKERIVKPGASMGAIKHRGWLTVDTTPLLVTVHAFCMIGCRAPECELPTQLDAIEPRARPLFCKELSAPRVLSVPALLNGIGDPRDAEIVGVRILSGTFNAHLLLDCLRTCKASDEECWLDVCDLNGKEASGREIHVRSPHWRFIACSLHPSSEECRTARVIL